MHTALALARGGKRCGFASDTDAYAVGLACSHRAYTPSRCRTIQEVSMSVNFAAIVLEPIFSMVMGILILAVPRFLNYFVAVYLVVSGILGLMHTVHV